MKSEVAGENSTGKAKQFKIEEWLRIVEEPMGVLNDCGWIVCTTMINGLPGGTEADVTKSIELMVIFSAKVKYA